MIWHLRLPGFRPERQKNPSGLISGDKLTIFDRELACIWM